MIIATIDEKYKLGVAFKHVAAQTSGSEPKAGRLKAQKFTKCEIYVINGQDAKLMSTGIARCVQGDQFNKAVGRKISLTRALKRTMKTDGVPGWISIFTKEERGKVWDAYWNRDHSVEEVNLAQLLEQACKIIDAMPAPETEAQAWTPELLKWWKTHKD